MRHHTGLSSLCCGLACWAFIFSFALCSQAGEPTHVAELKGGIIDLDTGVTSNMGGVSAAFNSVDNEYRVVWFDSRITGQNDVYAQRVSTEGMLLGINEEIITGTSSQTDTSVAYTPVTNQYFVTWRNQSGGPGSSGFNHAFGGPVSATGGLLVPAIDVSNGGLEATLAYNSTDNQFFLEARNFAGGGIGGIRGQRITGAGALIGGGITIATAGAPAPSGQVAYNSTSNRYLTTWRDQTDEDLKGRVYNADGTPVAIAFQISPMFPESGLAASVACDPTNDRYLVVFSEFCCSGVYGQFVGNAGAPIGLPFTIVESTANRLSPYVAFDPVNKVYLVAWTDSTTGALEVQLLENDGSPAGDPLPVANPGNASGPPRITTNSNDGGFIIAWADHTYSPTAKHDILGQLVDVIPNTLSADSDTLSANTGGVINFSLTAGGDQGMRNYLLLGGVTGTEPGTPLPGGLATLPVNWDIFTNLIISLANTSIFSNFLGSLDVLGEAAAQFDTLGPLGPSAVGINMYYAYLLSSPFDFTSTWVKIEIVP